MESISHADAYTTLTGLPRSAGEGALLLLGEHGSGRSHLLSSVHAAANTPTVLVRGNPAEGQFPLAGFASLFSALSPEQGAGAHRRFTLRSEDPDALFAAGYALLNLIRGLDLAPTLALIDDLDQMDHASRAVLGTIASHLTGTSLWLAATAADLDWRIPPEFAVTRLLPFSTGEIVEIMARERDVDDSTLRILATYAGGNPRALSEQIALLYDDQLTGAAPVVLPPPITPTIEQVTAATSNGLAPTAREILRTVAVAPLSHLAALNTVMPDATDDIEDLIDAGLLKRRGHYLAVIDPRLRSFLYWDQGSRARRAHHAALAAACRAHDQRLATWHRSATKREPQIVDQLLDAAISFVDEGRIGAAVEFVERALSKAEHIADHAELLIRLCSHLLRGGHLVLADRYSARAEPSEPGQSMDILNIRLMARLFNQEHLSDDELLTLANLHADANPEGACSMLCLGAAFRSERWETDKARRLVDHSLRFTNEVSESTRLKLAAMRDIIDGMEGTPATATPTLTRLDDSACTDPDLLLLRARALTVREAYSDARQLYTVVLNQPSSRALRHDLATYGTIRNEINANQYWLARAAADSWEGRAPSLTRGTSAFVHVQAWYAYSLGRWEVTEELIDNGLALASLEASQALRARTIALRGALRLLTGDVENAVMDLRQASAASTRFRNPTLLRHWADYTEVCVATGRTQEAATIVAALHRRLSAHRSRWGQLALMRCRALVEPGRRSLDLFDAAVQEFTLDELPYELGRTLRCLAVRQDELGMAVESQRTRTAAVEAFDTAGADAWSARTSRSAAPQAPAAGRGVGAPALQQLNQDERDVAIRVVQGLRNREIAQELFVSVRTVELRLTHVYRSLGVHSRAQLVALITGAGTSDGGSGPGVTPRGR